MNNLTLKRVAIDLALFLSVFLLPWWITLSLAFLLIFYFKFYFESILLAFFFDLLYSPENFLFGAYLLTIFAIILFMTLEILKKKTFLLKL